MENGKIKYSTISLSGSEYDRFDERMSGEPSRILDGKIDIDYACFKKSKTEKEVLKLAKAYAKNEAMKR